VGNFGERIEVMLLKEQLGGESVYAIGNAQGPS
jgi:hypothetical protein